MHYEHHPSNIFEHRVIITLDEDVVLSIFHTGWVVPTVVRDWLCDNVGRGGRTARGEYSWHAYGVEKNVLMTLGPFWIGFRSKEDAMLFRLTWTNWQYRK